MTDYSPIDCGLHSEFELAIMHRQPLRLSWQDGSGQTREDTVMPLDLRTSRHEEFLVARTSEQQVIELRLDSIQILPS